MSRTGFYPRKNADGFSRPGPYQHLAAEFTRRLAAQQEAGSTPDPRQAQIERLNERVATLEHRLRQREDLLRKLNGFKKAALSRIAAQHAEIERLWQQAAAAPLTVVRQLPASPDRPPVG